MERIKFIVKNQPRTLYFASYYGAYKKYYWQYEEGELEAIFEFNIKQRHKYDDNVRQIINKAKRSKFWKLVGEGEGNFVSAKRYGFSYKEYQERIKGFGLSACWDYVNGEPIF